MVQTLSLVCQNMLWGTPAAYQMGQSRSLSRVIGCEKLTKQLLSKKTWSGAGGDKAAMWWMSWEKKSYWLNLPGVSFSVMSTKYLSSSKSLAFCTWCRMGPVQYIWLKLKGVTFKWRHMSLYRECLTDFSREAIKLYITHNGQRSVNLLDELSSSEINFFVLPKSHFILLKGIPVKIPDYN